VCLITGSHTIFTHAGCQEGLSSGSSESASASLPRWRDNRLWKQATAVQGAARKGTVRVLALPACSVPGRSRRLCGDRNNYTEPS